MECKRISKLSGNKDGGTKRLKGKVPITMTYIRSPYIKCHNFFSYIRIEDTLVVVVTVRLYE